MDTILDFIVDNYIWIVIICVFLILVLIGFIADQKIKLKKIREQKSQGVASSDINVPVQESVVQTETVAPAPVAAEPVVNEPIVSNEVIETPTFEPVTSVVEEPITVPEVPEPIVESAVEPVVETVSEPVVEVANDNLFSEPITEEVPQTILDIPDNVADIPAPIQEEVVEPIIEDTEIIEDPEIIDEVSEENIVNRWEPELKTENPEIINEIQIEDSI